MRALVTVLACAALLGACGAAAPPARSSRPPEAHAPARERVRPLPRPTSGSSDDELLIDEAMGL